MHRSDTASGTSITPHLPLAWTGAMNPPLHIGRKERTLPSWDEADRRLRESGRVSKVNHPSPGTPALTTENRECPAAGSSEALLPRTNDMPSQRSDRIRPAKAPSEKPSIASDCVLGSRHRDVAASDCQFGWLQGTRNLLWRNGFWLQRPDTYRIHNSCAFRSAAN
jgi:hypothetical protein